jgi:hypothetical protein
MSLFDKSQTQEDAAKIMRGITRLKNLQGLREAQYMAALKGSVTELGLLHDDVRSMGVDPKSQAGQVVVLGILLERGRRNKSDDGEDYPQGIFD